jgi:hypothetical protein
LSPGELPAVTVPPSLNAGLSFASFLQRRIRSRCLILRDQAIFRLKGDEFVGEFSRFHSLDGLHVALVSEAILLLAR